MNKRLARHAQIARIGLAIVFLYAGVSAILKPYDWIGFIPMWVTDYIPFTAQTLLHFHSGFEIILGLILLAGWQSRIFGVLAVLDLVVILTETGINGLTFQTSD